MEITGGFVYAIGDKGSGVGTGVADGLGCSVLGTLLVSSGNVSCFSLSSACLGAGFGSDQGNSSVGDITIINSAIYTDINSEDGEGSGIGSGGASGAGSSIVSNILIINTHVSMIRCSGAGIGSGGCLAGLSTVRNITIVNGTIDIGSKRGAGIGAGFSSSLGTSAIDQIVICNGFVSAASVGGSGIGPGKADAGGTSDVKNVTIVDGNVTASSGTGIGIGSNVTAVAIRGGSVNATAIRGSSVSLSGPVDLCVISGTADGIDSVSLSLVDVTLTASTDARRLFGASPSIWGSIDATILYSTASPSQAEPIADVPGIEMGSLTFPIDAVWTVLASSTSLSWNKSAILVDGAVVRRMFLTVGSPGDYVIAAYAGDHRGYIVSDAGEVFHVQQTVLFMKEARVFTGGTLPASTMLATKAPESANITSTTEPEGKLPIAIIVVAAGVVTVVGAVVATMLVRRSRRRAKAKDELSMSMGRLVANETIASYF
jgi:hypothetical protein